MLERCGNCRWYVEYEGICVSGDSDNVDDFMSQDDYCPGWEENRKLCPTDSEKESLNKIVDYCLGF